MFKSKLQGGFECCYAKVENNLRLDLLTATKHDQYCREDYKLLKEIGIFTAREGLSWSAIDKGNGIYEFDRFENMMKIAQEEDMQIIWSLNHFDYPDYLDPFSELFIKAFVEYSKRAIDLIKKYSIDTIYIIPINEISFFSWIGADVGWWAPYTRDRGSEFKEILVRASIEGMEAMWNIDPDIKFIQVDPISKRKALTRTPKALQIQRDFVSAKFEAWDLLSGKRKPELGGDKKYLQICGVNYYYYNQQRIVELPSSEVIFEPIKWGKKGRVPFTNLLMEVYKRYKAPILITETGSWGNLRATWWRRMYSSVKGSLDKNLPILGVCAYPIIDRPDWADGHLTNSGFWDFIEGDESLTRIPVDKVIALGKRLNELKYYEAKSNILVLKEGKRFAKIKTSLDYSSTI